MGILRRHQDGVAEGFTDAESVVSSAPTTVTPLDIQQKEFGVSRFGGYKMRDVDVFLDQLTDVVSTLVAENERLREGGSGAHVAIGEPELGDVRRQADEMIARAREEAAKIVAEAHVQAMSAGSPLASGDDRAAVDAFLAQERAFLQGLGRLVQDHAESVKGMAKTARRRPAARPEPIREATAAGGSSQAASDRTEGGVEASAVREPDAGARPTAEPPSPPASPPRSEPPSPPASPMRSEPSSAAPPARVEPVSASPAPREPSAPSQRPPARPPESMPDVEAERPKAPPVPVPPDTIRIEDPEPAVSSRRDSEDAPRREGTLRELFWGEEN
jgi:DivIVA domain-containing protein